MTYLMAHVPGELKWSCNEFVLNPRKLSFSFKGHLFGDFLVWLNPAVQLQTAVGQRFQFALFPNGGTAVDVSYVLTVIHRGFEATWSGRQKAGGVGGNSSRPYLSCSASLSPVQVGHVFF